MTPREEIPAGEPAAAGAGGTGGSAPGKTPDSYGKTGGAAPRPFKEAIEDALKGRLPPNAILDMGRPGEILRSAGLLDLSMRVRQRTVRRKTNKHEELTREVLQALPDALNDPMLVYRSPSDPGAHAIVTSIPTRDGPVTAYFSVRQDQRGENILDAKTIFGKKPGEILEELEKLPPGGIAYANEKAFDGWLVSQARSALSGTSHQHQQAIKSLRTFFSTEDSGSSGTAPAAPDSGGGKFRPPQNGQGAEPSQPSRSSATEPVEEVLHVAPAPDETARHTGDLDMMRDGGRRPLTPDEAPGGEVIRFAGTRREEIAPKVYTILEAAYRHIGGQYKSAESLLAEADTVFDVGYSEGRPVWFSVTKPTPFGYKICAFGTDGSPAGKTMWSAMFNLLQRPGYYAELSGKPQEIAIARNIPRMKSEDAAAVLGESITPLPDGWSYERTISGLNEKHTKIMFGIPWKTTVKTPLGAESKPSKSSSQNPQTPPGARSFRTKSTPSSSTIPPSSTTSPKEPPPKK